MTGKFKNIILIAQYGAIKILPGLVNILIIPYLLAALGVNEYGLYSLLFGYALLSATVVGAVVTQPMYRFLSSNKSELEFFKIFVLSSALISFIITTIAVFAHEVNLLRSLGFGVFSFCAVMLSFISVEFQIQGSILNLVKVEAIRVSIFLASILLQEKTLSEFSIDNVVLSLVLSYLVPLTLYWKSFEVVKVPKSWLVRSVGFGLKSALWLLLAGAPLLIGKTVLSKISIGSDFGSYSALVDILYRGFGILNSAILMWAYPVLSKAQDALKFSLVRKTMLYAIICYVSSGFIALIVIGYLLYENDKFGLDFTGGAEVVAMVMVSCFLWQGLSIVHKPLELNLKTTYMIMAMLWSGLLFCIVLFSNLVLFSIGSINSVSIALIASSLLYSLLVYINTRLILKNVKTHTEQL